MLITWSSIKRGALRFKLWLHFEQQKKKWVGWWNHLFRIDGEFLFPDFTEQKILMTVEDGVHYDDSNHGWLCDYNFFQKAKKVKKHRHSIGSYRVGAQQTCNNEVKQTRSLIVRTMIRKLSNYNFNWFSNSFVEKQTMTSGSMLLHEQKKKYFQKCLVTWGSYVCIYNYEQILNKRGRYYDATAGNPTSPE